MFTKSAQVINQVNNFRLIFYEEPNYYYISKILQDQSEIIIAIVYLPLGAKIPSISTIEDHLQNYVIDFEEYKNFIQLVDEAYLYFENKKDDF